MNRRAHENDADVAELLDNGLTHQQIAEQLGMSPAGVSRARARLGRPPRRPSAAATLEDAWRIRTQPTDDGHLLWTGPRGTHGQLVLKYQERQYTAARIAFRIRYGREPEGAVRMTCDRDGCVYPDHTEDTAMRQRTNVALRYLYGRGPVDDQCANGHDQAEHGFIDSEGYSRCRICQRDRKRRHDARKRATACELAAYSELHARDTGSKTRKAA